MNLSTKYFLTVIWVLLLYAIGTWLFFRGFLLKRSVVTQNSTCVERPALAAVSGPDDLCDGAGCWMPRRFDRAVVLVIDALRYDFVAYNSSIDISVELPYQNKLKMLNELLERKPQNTRLYHFWADPPTTTMQRLKGLTTGSLPTFVDVSSNFDTAEITEDNFIDQFVKSNRQIVFMGDDTWTHLFPGRFAKQFDFPSFNVKDLHTVDNGVIEHLIPEMKRSNWDLLIGHFLGVDHCGHRYGPQHPAMAEKLAQLDGVLRTVIAELDNDTVLFVFGDHGMTGTGDHGGDSSNELDAALLVYSPSVISMEPPQQGNYGSVSQVDLVPTISLLVGLPIPFSNLGSVIPELFSFCSSWNASSHKENSILRSIEALRLNAQQMQRYLLAYTTVTDEFPYVLFSDLTSQLRRLESTLNDTLRTWDVSHKHSLKQLEALKQGYESYLQRGKAMCQEIWVNFNVASIVLGITMISAALLLSVFLYNSVPPNGQFTTNVYIMFATTLVVFLLVLFLWFLDLTFVSLLPSLLLALLTTVVFAVMFINVLATEPLTWRLVLQDLFTSITRPNTASLFSVLSLGLYVAAYFSNSFVVYEDQVTMFLLQTWLCVHFFTMNTCLVGPDRSGIEPTQCQRRYHAKFDVGRVLTSPRSIALLLTLAALVCVRLGGNFRGCREEQWLCERSTFLRPLMSLTTTTHKNVRYFLSVMSVVVVVVGVYYWLRYHGNLNGHSPVVMCQRYSLPITGVAISLYWAMQTLPRNILENLHGWQVTVFPRIAYILTGTTFLCTAIAPLCVFSPHVLNIAPGSGSNYIPRAFNHIKYNWRKHLGPRTAERGAVTERKPPVVYGLATVYSSAFLVLTATLALLLMLVLRDGLAPSIVLHLATMFLVLELHASGQRLSDSNTEGDYSAPWSCVCCWALLASHNFFATGQQNVFQTIQWEMAYTGFHGDFDVNIIPATVLILNTFAGHIIGAFTLPLLVYWPQVRGDVLFYFGMREGGGSDGKGMRQKGELRLHEDPAGLRTASLKIILGFLIFSGAKLLGATSAAGLHRRHLMVWKIFAPRVIYEGATFLVLGPLLLLVFLIMLRIDRALSGWLGDLVK